MTVSLKHNTPDKVSFSRFFRHLSCPDDHSFSGYSLTSPKKPCRMSATLRGKYLKPRKGQWRNLVDQNPVSLTSFQWLVGNIVFKSLSHKLQNFSHLIGQKQMPVICNWYEEVESIKCKAPSHITWSSHDQNSFEMNLISPLIMTRFWNRCLIQAASSVMRWARRARSWIGKLHMFIILKYLHVDCTK